MVEVNLWSALRRFTDGADKVEVEAATIGEMLDALCGILSLAYVTRNAQQKVSGIELDPRH